MSHYSLWINSEIIHQKIFKRHNTSNNTELFTLTEYYVTDMLKFLLILIIDYSYIELSTAHKISA